LANAAHAADPEKSGIYVLVNRSKPGNFSWRLAGVIRGILEHLGLWRHR
jgi:hypothetical protein